MIVLSVVIPVYRAEGCLSALHERLTQALLATRLSYEIVFVEDHSPDQSWVVLREIANQDPSVRAYKLSRNFGQHAAITAGLVQCKGQYAVVMDCDLQDPPEVIPLLYQKAQEGFDVVLARRKEKQHSIFRRLCARLYFKLLNMTTGKSLNGAYGSFSLISRKVIDAYKQMIDRNRHYMFIVQWLGFNTADIEYEHAERFSGESSYTLKTLIHHALQGLFFQTTTLLRWIIYLGFSFSILALFGVCLIFYRYYVESTLPGWTSTSVLILGMSGIILICLGVVGLYLGQVFEQVLGRPLYIIDQECIGSQ